MGNDGMIVQTVRGPIPAETLGITLPHEHLLRNRSSRVNWPEPADDPEGFRALADRNVALDIFALLQIDASSNYDNVTLDSNQNAIDELAHFKRAGGVSLVDCTPSASVGRDPIGIRAISEGSGINVVMGTGQYIADFHPPEVAKMTAEAIAQAIIDEFKRGVDGTGIRPGVIGELGNSWPLHPDEAKVLRGAGMAQSQLGCAVSIHPGGHPEAPKEILALLRDGGADISRVIMGHLDRTVQSIDGLKALGETGCFLEHDLFGRNVTESFDRDNGIDWPSDAQRIGIVRDLAAAGYGSQLLISHDICYKTMTRRFGGQGYDHILRVIVPWMRNRGVDDPTITKILVDNPRHALAMKAGFN
jgi:phosphotriesterase-related protein